MSVAAPGTEYIHSGLYRGDVPEHSGPRGVSRAYFLFPTFSFFGLFSFSPLALVLLPAAVLQLKKLALPKLTTGGLGRGGQGTRRVSPHVMRAS